MKKKISIILCLLLLISLLPTPTNVFAASSVTVNAYNTVTNDSTGNISFYLNVKNSGSDSISLSTLTLRYYFTNDGNQENAFACDYSPVGSSNVTGRFGTDGDSRYLEIGFTPAAGSLAKGATLPVNIRIWKTDWSSFKQSNDYSFNATASSYVAANHITAYIAKKLAWGIEPGTSTEPTPTAPTPPTFTTAPTATPTVAPTSTPSTPSNMKEISDAYMKNIKITPQCPSYNTTRRNGVSYGTLTHKTYYSNTTKSNRGVNIVLPPNYNPGKKYPVLYLLHGIFGDENSMVSSSNTSLINIVGNQIADGNAKEMIVVCPNMYAATNGQAPSFSDEGVAGYDNFINDLLNDLMPYIAKNYSVLTDRKYQAIAGFSMGGREALFIGITRPDVFGYVMGISPAPGVTPARDNFMSHKGQLSEDQFKIADPDQTPYAIMISCGTNDSVVGKFPEGYHNTLTRNNQNHIWYTVPGADHDNNAINSGVNNFVGAIFHADK